MPDISSGNIGIIVLAAGYSERFKGDKRKASMKGGSTLLDTTLSHIPDSFRQRVLVLHPGDEQFGEAYSENWTLCIAGDARLGMGHSLAAAMELAEDWSGAVIALGDMPYVQSDTYRAIQHALVQHPIVRPCCQGRPGNPVGFQSSLFPALGNLSGDKGARVLFREQQERIHLLPCNDWGIIKDIDTRDALATVDDGA